MTAVDTVVPLLLPHVTARKLFLGVAVWTSVLLAVFKEDPSAVQPSTWLLGLGYFKLTLHIHEVSLLLVPLALDVLNKVGRLLGFLFGLFQFFLELSHPIAPLEFVESLNLIVQVLDLVYVPLIQFHGLIPLMEVNIVIYETSADCYK